MGKLEASEYISAGTPGKVVERTRGEVLAGTPRRVPKITLRGTLKATPGGIPVETCGRSPNGTPEGIATGLNFWGNSHLKFATKQPEEFL